MRNYKNENIFNYLTDVEKLRDKLKKQNPTFKFSSDKGDVAEAYVKSVFGLKQAPYGEEGYDLVSKNGIKVSVKNVWEYNPYRGLHLSGGSNVKPNAYKKADHLICVGRDKNNIMRIMGNLPIKYLEKYIQGGKIHPRVTMRHLIKVNSLIPENLKLKPVKNIYPDAVPEYYPKDLNEFFKLPKNFWSNVTMLWRNVGNKFHTKTVLQDFMTGQKKGNHNILREWDVALFYLISKNVLKGIDYRTSTYIAFHQLIKKPLPEIFPVSNGKLLNYMSDTGYTTIKKNRKYHKYLSQFMTSTYANSHRTHSYWTKNDIKILDYFVLLKKDLKKGDQGSWHKAFLKACKKYPKPTDVKLINPKKIKFRNIKVILENLIFKDSFMSNI